MSVVTRNTIIVVLTVILISALIACGSSTTAPEAPADEMNGEALLQERCTGCHGLDRTTQAQKTRDEWERTVVRMVEKGAKLDASEQERLIDYLAETYGP